MAFVLSFFVSTLLILVSCVFMMGGRLSREQLTPYECGFDSKQKGRVPFSASFIFFVLLFLIFDVELVVLFVIPIVSGMLSFSLISFVIFLGVIFWSFLLEEEKMFWE